MHILTVFSKILWWTLIVYVLLTCILDWYYMTDYIITLLITWMTDYMIDWMIDKRCHSEIQQIKVDEIPLYKVKFW